MNRKSKNSSGPAKKEEDNRLADSQLAGHQRKLDKERQELDKERQELDKRRHAVEIRENKVKEQELEAANGFQKLKAQLLEEVSKEQHKRHSELDKELKERRTKSIKELDDELENRKVELNEKETLHKEQLQELQKKEQSLLKLEAEIKSREIEANEGFAAQKHEKLGELDKLLQTRRLEVSKVLEEHRNKQERAIEEEFKSRREDRTREIALYEQQYKENIEERNQALKDEMKEMEHRISEFSKEKEWLLEQQSELSEREVRVADLTLREKLLQSKERNIEALINEKAEQKKAEYESEMLALKKLLEECRQEKGSIQMKLDRLETTQRRFSKYPNAELDEILEEKEKTVYKHEEKIRWFEDKYSHIDDEDLADHSQWKNWEEKQQRLYAKITVLEDENIEYKNSKTKLTQEEYKNEELQTELELKHEKIINLQAELKSLTEGYKADFDKCKSSIEKPYITFDESVGKEKKLEHYSRSEISREELNWLNSIDKGCKSSDIIYPKRLLQAFHTSLKCSAWTSLTLLAGTSGTGKSLLPMVYSYYGGLVFNSTAIQPNWSDPRDLLGYYDLTANDFNATPLMNLLSQSQREYDENEGFEDALLLVLLDEMNLAQPEQYFSDFLSKLEERRNSGSAKTVLEINTGASDKYKLDLGSNILFCGTMNEDESTHTLSDKVIDRSNMLLFPTPKELYSKKETGLTGKRAPLLKKENWNSWLIPFEQKNRENKEKGEKLIKHYRTVVDGHKKRLEEITAEMSSHNRGIGNRVWQATEQYISIYPELLSADTEDKLTEAAKKAFEDQLVMKVMPKLRGIEDPKNRLRKIGELLQDYDMHLDFEKGCRNDYGFHFNSADYLGKSGSSDD